MANGTDIAKAYVQIIPSAEGIKGKLEEIMGDEADSAGKKSGGKFGQAFGNVLKTAGKIGAAALGAAATGIGALTKSAVEGYAAYEQLVGGVETLFGAGGATLQEFAASIGKTAEGAMDEYGRMMTAQNTVLRNASDAFKTAGLSTNEYMETVTSFSASLISSLEGDTLAAANAADLAIRDMSDNANKMGTDMGAIQNAYQGFAKQNYTMLDNLKLGYGGTKEEMSRLVADAEKLDSTFRVARDENDKLVYSFADIVRAINIVQTDMGITGTTAKEAASTISGSVNMMKGAWANLVAGFGNGNADMEKLFGDLVSSAETVLGNILPVAEQALGGIADAAGRLAPVIAEKLPGIAQTVLPPLVSAAGTLISGLLDALIQSLPTLIPVAFEAISTIATGLIENLPTIISTGLDVLVSLAQGIADNLPTLIPTIVDVVLQIVDTLTQPDTLSSLVDASIAIIVGLAEGLIEAIPQLLEKAPEIVANLVDAIVENAPKLLRAAFELIKKIGEGIRDNFHLILQKGGEIVGKVVSGIGDAISKLWDVGMDIVRGIWKGISDGFGWIKEKISGWIGNVMDFIKGLFGIKSPSKWAENIIGLNIAKGIGVGFVDGIPAVEQAMRDNMPQLDPIQITGKYGAVGNGYGYGPAYNYGGVTIVIEGRDKDAAQLARELQTELTRRTAGFDPWRQPA